MKQFVWSSLSEMVQMKYFKWSGWSKKEQVFQYSISSEVSQVRGDPQNKILEFQAPRAHRCSLGM